KRVPARQTDARYLDRRSSEFDSLGPADAGCLPAVVSVPDPDLRSALPTRLSPRQMGLQALPRFGKREPPPAAADARRGPRGAVKAQARRLRWATVRAAAGTQARLQPRLSR